MVTGPRSRNKLITYCNILVILTIRRPVLPALIRAPEVSVAFGRRRLGDIHRVGGGEGLLKPLLQRLVQQALLSALAVVRLSGLFGGGARSGHGHFLLVWRPARVRRFGGRPIHAR